MAPLRSSRSTRNQDHAAAARARTGVLDLDPTDGLPVTKWLQVPARVNQDTDLAALNSSTTNSADWNSQFNTPQFPWPEPPIPTYLKDLPSWNQEMIRRARVGNTSVKLSVWDRKTTSWISAAEAEKKVTTEKSQNTNTHDQAETNSGQNGTHESPKSEHEDEDSDSKSEDEHMQDEETTPFKNPTSAAKRRKTAGHLEPRVFEVKKWIQLPMSVAEKTAEPKFLADRRPGMPALYNPTYQNTIFGAFLSSHADTTANYDLGDGGGLGNATGVLGTAPNAESASTPVRKNMPPKRKKKKIGGPGRKKAITNIAGENGTGDGSLTQASGEPGSIVPRTQAENGDGTTGEDVTMGDGEEEDVSGSGSEEEGSEEGEIEDGGRGETVPESHSNAEEVREIDAAAAPGPLSASPPETQAEPVPHSLPVSQPELEPATSEPIAETAAPVELPAIPVSVIEEVVPAPTEVAPISMTEEPVPTWVPEPVSETAPPPIPEELVSEPKLQGEVEQVPLPGMLASTDVGIVAPVIALEQQHQPSPPSQPPLMEEKQQQEPEQPVKISDDLLGGLDAAIDQKMEGQQQDDQREA